MTQLEVYSHIPDTQAKIIGTHDGTFHCDEALACAMLRMTSDFKDAVVVRTRDPELLSRCNIVVDVGAKYEAGNLRFDHHQPDFQDTMVTSLATYKTRLSSAGLVYRHFGKQILKDKLPALEEAQLEELYDAVYKSFVEHVDGIDNGVEHFKSATEGAELVRNYRVTTTLSCRVANLAPRWNQDTSPERFNAGFVKAVAITGDEFNESVDYFGSAWLPARDIVREVVSRRLDVHSSGQIIRLDKFCPWQEHLYEVERSHNIEGEILYALFPDMKSGWRIRAVGIEGSSFGQRKSLPWKGMRGDDLSKASGVEGGVFVHAAGFIGGNETYEGALEMAIKALAM